MPGAAIGCTGDTRVIYEGTVGFWYKIYKGDKEQVQFGPQYSQVDRVSWFGKASSTILHDPQGYDMLFTAFPLLLTLSTYTHHSLHCGKRWEHGHSVKLL